MLRALGVPCLELEMQGLPRNTPRPGACRVPLTVRARLTPPPALGVLPPRQALASAT